MQHCSREWDEGREWEWEWEWDEGRERDEGREWERDEAVSLYVCTMCVILCICS